MTKRTAALLAIRIAGRHNDGGLYARTVLAGAVSRAAADAAWREGASSRISGAACTCGQADCPAKERFDPSNTGS